MLPGSLHLPLQKLERRAPDKSNWKAFGKSPNVIYYIERRVTGASGC